MDTFGRSLLILTLASWPALAAAQTPAPPAIPRWDATVLTGGLFAQGRRPFEDNFGDDWFRSGQISLAVGRLWTTHLRTEVSVFAAGEDGRTIYRYVPVPEYPYPTFQNGEQFAAARGVTATAAWQFFDNQWVHPFVEAGVEVESVRTRLLMPATVVVVGTPATPIRVEVPEYREESTTTTSTYAVIGSGVKLYATPRLFFRTDIRLSIGTRLEHVSVRGGAGFDF